MKLPPGRQPSERLADDWPWAMRVIPELPNPTMQSTPWMPWATEAMGDAGRTPVLNPLAVQRHQMSPPRTMDEATGAPLISEQLQRQSRRMREDIDAEIEALFYSLYPEQDPNYSRLPLFSQSAKPLLGHERLKRAMERRD